LREGHRTQRGCFSSETMFLCMAGAITAIVIVTTAGTVQLSEGSRCCHTCGFEGTQNWHIGANMIAGLLNPAVLRL
jgi:hypothetical protein